MRTAVIRVKFDPQGALDAAAIEKGMATLIPAVAEAGISILDSNAAALPAHRRELHFLADVDDAVATQKSIAELCRDAFDTTPANGAVTYISRGRDEDALGVLAGFGLSGELVRTPGDDEWDVVTVQLAKADLARVPESRIQTALEASLNCEVRIVAV